MNTFEQTSTSCTVCKKVLLLEHTMTCKVCNRHVCYNCYSVQDQDEKSRGWILCDNCAEEKK